MKKSNEQHTSLLGKSESKVSGNLDADKKHVIESSNASSSSEDDDMPVAVLVVDEVEQTNYMYMFAIMPRFNPINNWNNDHSEAFIVHLFSLTGERHHVPVGNNFDWIDFGKQNAISEKRFSSSLSVKIYLY